MQLTLRDYQTEAIEAVEGAWARDLNRPAVVIPTGTGKTVIFAALVQKLASQGIRAVTLVHRDELANQAAEKLANAMPDKRVGIVKAGSNQTDADAIVASVQTLVREGRRNQLVDVGALIVDEAHHAMAPSYRTILEHYGAFGENGRGLPTSGWTATLVRGDGKGLGTVWPEVVYEKPIEWFCERDYLVWPVGKAIKVDGMDLGQVARSRGDFQDGDLGDQLVQAGAGEHIAQAYLEHAKDRQGVLFAPTIASAASFADDLNAVGIKTELLHYKIDTKQRADIYTRLRSGETQVLANPLLLTEGWDEPQISCCVVARPTSNAGLFTQMVGRVLRPFPGKTDALVLDVVGSGSKHKLVTLKDLSQYQPRDGETMKEAHERTIREQAEKGEMSGVRTAEDFDLFGRSKSAWLQTYAGIWFIPTRQRVYFLWPTKEGKFWVGRCSNRTTADGEWLAKDVDLGYGMAWAEQYATQEDPSVANRGASWRIKRQPPSPAQIDVAMRVGVPYQGKTKAEVSDKLSVHFASRLLDPKPKKG